LDLTTLLVGVAVMGAAFVKGMAGMAFPLVATPPVALLTDIRTAIVVLLVPNMLMDVLQIARKRFPLEHLKRLGTMMAASIVGTFVGTYLLVTIPVRLVNLIVAAIVFAFVGQNLWATPVAVPARWEPVTSPVIGFVTGVLNGISNISSPVLAIYLLSLRLGKFDFVKSISLVFLALKVGQTAAVWRWRPFTADRLWLSGAATAFALGGFAIGLQVQDRIPQRIFTRVLLGILTASGLALIAKALQ